MSILRILFNVQNRIIDKSENMIIDVGAQETEELAKKENEIMFVNKRYLNLDFEQILNRQEISKLNEMRRHDWSLLEREWTKFDILSPITFFNPLVMSCHAKYIDKSKGN